MRQGPVDEVDSFEVELDKGFSFHANALPRRQLEESGFSSDGTARHHNGAWDEDGVKKVEADFVMGSKTTCGGEGVLVVRCNGLVEDLDGFEEPQVLLVLLFLGPELGGIVEEFLVERNEYLWIKLRRGQPLGFSVDAACICIPPEGHCSKRCLASS